MSTIANMELNEFINTKMEERECQVDKKDQLVIKAVPEIVNIFKNSKFYLSILINLTKCKAQKGRNNILLTKRKTNEISMDEEEKNTFR